MYHAGVKVSNIEMFKNKNKVTQPASDVALSRLFFFFLWVCVLYMEWMIDTLYLMLLFSLPMPHGMKILNVSGIRFVLRLEANINYNEVKPKPAFETVFVHRWHAV